MYKKILLFFLLFILIFDFIPVVSAKASASDYNSADVISDFKNTLSDNRFSSTEQVVSNMSGYDTSTLVSFLKKYELNNIVGFSVSYTSDSSWYAKMEQICVRGSTKIVSNSSTNFTCYNDNSFCSFFSLELCKYYDKDNNIVDITCGYSTNTDDKCSIDNIYNSSVSDLVIDGTYVKFYYGTIENFNSDEYGYADITDDVRGLVTSPKQLRLGELYFTYPSKNAYLGGKFEKALSAFTFTLMGKVPFSSSISSDYALSKLDDDCSSIKSKFQTHMIDSVNMTIGGYPMGVENFVSVDFIGYPSQWLKDGYICFTMSGKAIMKASDVKKITHSKLDSVDLVASVDCPVSINVKFFYDYGYSRYKSKPHPLILKMYSDNNGDGKDDTTGETIPPYSQIDNDGDGSPDGTIEDIDSINDVKSDSSSSDDDSNSSILDFFSSCIRSINNFFEVSLQLIQNAQSFITGFPQFINGLFSCFPNAISTFIALGLEIMIIIAIIKFIRG